MGSIDISVTGSNGISSSVTIFPTSQSLSNISLRTCSSYMKQLQASPDYYTFLEYYGFNKLYRNLQTGLSNLSAQGSLAQTNTGNMSTYLTNVNQDISSFAFITNCVTESADPVETVGELKKAKKELQLSKERYDMLQSPEKHVSNYEGTFPIYRPLQERTLFLLFALALFLMLLALLLFLRTQGVVINITMPDTTISIPGILYTYATYAGVAAALGIVIGYAIHVYYK